MNVRFILRWLLPTALVVAGIPLQAAAANTAITGGTNGPDCNSGGYFTPSTVAINSGDTVTISVPSNDPYAGGVEVHGFPQGSFVVARGGSVTTNPITATVSYYGTWPSTGCMKGRGTVAVNAPQATPTPTPGGSGGSSTPPPAGSSSGTTKSSTTTTSTPKAGASSTPTSSASPSAGGSPSIQPLAAGTQSSNSPTPSASSAPKKMSLTLAAATGGGLLVVIIAAVLVVWRFGLHRRLALDSGSVHTNLPGPPPSGPAGAGGQPDNTISQPGNTGDKPDNSDGGPGNTGSGPSAGN